MSSLTLSAKLQLPFKLGMQQNQCAYLEQILMDSFISGATMDKSMEYAGVSSYPQTGASLNEVSRSLNSWDLITKLNKKEEKDSASSQIYMDSMNYGFQPITDQLSTDFVSYEQNVQNLQPIQIKLDTLKDEISTEQSLDNSTTTKHSKEIKTPKKGKDSDAVSFMQEERRKLIQKINKSSDDQAIFQKRVKKLRKNAQHGAESYRGSRYWGVSKNKSKWQVMITLNHYKEYNGGFSDENEAARVYDRKAICTFGLKAKTNNTYTKKEVVEILMNDCPIVL